MHLCTSFSTCPNKKNNNKEAPEASSIEANEIKDPRSSHLCYAWGRIHDQDTFVLFGANHNLISTELAQRLRITMEDLGPALDISGPFTWLEVPITSLIGKIRLHVQEYTDNEEFIVSPLNNKDVILGAPWFHRMYAKLEYPSRDITITCSRGRKIILKNKAKGNTIPIVSSDSVQKIMISSLFAYLIFVQLSQSFESSSSQEVQVNNINISNANLHNEACKEEVESYLKQYKDCFSDELPFLNYHLYVIRMIIGSSSSQEVHLQIDPLIVYHVHNKRR